MQEIKQFDPWYNIEYAKKLERLKKKKIMLVNTKIVYTQKKRDGKGIELINTKTRDSVD